MLNTVDLGLLKQQKASLVKLIAHAERFDVGLKDNEVKHLDGLLELLDTVQDGIADHGRVELEIAP